MLMLISTLILMLISNLRAVDVSIFRVLILIFCRPQKLVDVNILQLLTLIFLTLVTRPKLSALKYPLLKIETKIYFCCFSYSAGLSFECTFDSVWLHSPSTL